MITGLRRLPCGYGLVALGDLPLAAINGHGDDDGRVPDLLVIRNDELLMPSSPNGMNWVAQGGELWLEIPGTAQVLLSRDPLEADPGYRLPGISYRPLSDHGVLALARLLKDLLVPLWCHWMGEVLLRGTLLRRESKVVWLVSRSSCESSTMAALLTAHGFEVLGDRGARAVMLPADTLGVWPSGLPLRMRWQEYEALGLQELRGQPVRPQGQVHESKRVPPPFEAPMPLASIWFLSSRSAGKPDVPEQLGLMKSVQFWRAHCWQPSLAFSGDQWVRNACLAAVSVRHGCAFQWQFPLDAHQRPACAERLAQELGSAVTAGVR